MQPTGMDNAFQEMNMSFYSMIYRLNSSLCLWLAVDWNAADLFARS
jgi:hypothetical protein